MSKCLSVLAITLPLILSGCATAGKTALLGVGIGSVTGASVGIIAGENGPRSHRTQDALIGAALGGLIGAVIGNETFKAQAKKDEAQNFDVNSTRFEMFGSAGDKDKKPSLKPAQVRVHYVEDQIKDGTFVPAHFEYEIAEPARWEKSK